LRLTRRRCDGNRGSRRLARDEARLELMRDAGAERDLGQACQWPTRLWELKLRKSGRIRLQGDQFPMHVLKGAAMKRRQFLGAGLAMAAGSTLRVPLARSAPVNRVRPGMPGWPTEADWATLKQAANGRVSPITLPNFDGPDAKKLLANPFYIGDEPALTQS